MPAPIDWDGYLASVAETHAAPDWATAAQFAALPDEVRARAYGRLPVWAAKVTDQIRLTGNVALAVTAAGISREILARWRTACPLFAQAYSDAELDFQDGLEQELFVQAMVHHNTRALLRLLQARHPAYANREDVTVHGPQGGPIPHTVEHVEGMREALKLRLLRTVADAPPRLRAGAGGAADDADDDIIDGHAREVG